MLPARCILCGHRSVGIRQVDCHLNLLNGVHEFLWIFMDNLLDIHALFVIVLDDVDWGSEVGGVRHLA